MVPALQEEGEREGGLLVLDPKGAGHMGHCRGLLATAFLSGEVRAQGMGRNLERRGLSSGHKGPMDLKDPQAARRYKITILIIMMRSMS